MSGLVSYSAARSRIPALTEFFDGLIVPLNLRGQITAGTAETRMLTASSNFAVTWIVRPDLRISESFRWHSFRVPGATSQLESALFGTSLLAAAQAFNPATCPAPFTAATCPQHNLGSPADLIASFAGEFLGDDEKESFTQAEYDFNRHEGITLGYRYAQQQIAQQELEQDFETFFPPFAQRDLCEQSPVSANGSCEFLNLFSLADRTPIHRNGISFSDWVRLFPADRLRLNFETELNWADRSYTRVDPRQQQHYRVRARYAPRSWASVAAALNWQEQRNGIATVRERQHNRSFALNATVTHGAWGFDANYEYSNIFARGLICYISSVLPPAAQLCPTDDGLFLATSSYASSTNFGRAAFFWKPASRVQADIGYTITHADGNTVLLNPLAPTGSLRFAYHQPAAALAIDLRKGLTWKGSWGYYDYAEPGAAGPTFPRNFHANLGTMSLRYSF
jgi:hypothetical protein